MEIPKEANLELAMLDSRAGVKLAGLDCALVNFHRSRFLLANGFNELVLRGIFFRV